MPGLLGIASTEAPSRTRERFSAALQRMLRHGRLASEHVTALDGRLILGNVHRASTGDASERVCANALPEALLHGVVYNEPFLRRGLAGGSGATTGSREELLAELYQKGDGFIEGLRGEYCLALYDPTTRRVLVATDAIASYPVYWVADSGGLVFSSDLSALLVAARQRPRLDLQAVANYLTIGAVLGEKTLASGVQVLGPGTILVYDVESGVASTRSYFELATLFENKTDQRERYLEEVQAAFRNAVDRAMTAGGQIGLSLSGGLDSRALLSAVNGRAASIRTYTLGVDGCADQVIAQKLARIAGSQHQFFALGKEYLRDFLPNMADMVSRTDGMYLSHGLTEMLAVQFLDQTGIEVLLRGHGGELAKAHLAWPLHTDKHVYSLKTVDEFVQYLSGRANYITPRLPLSRVLTPEAAAQAGAGSQQAFAEVLAGKGLSPAQGCSYLYLRELHRRFTVPSLELFRTRVDVRLPYVDQDFLTVLLAAPPEWRDDTRIHQALTEAGIPGLLKVRNSNTGAPADAGPALEFVLDKCNTILKRMNVHGYRHYHDFDGWMRTMLLQSVEAELLSPHAAIQSFVNRPALATLVHETRTGEADHAYLLQVLLILELWQRENRIEAAA
jgi:asparagine synthase (glutamine-hydrolysing)